MNSERDRLAEEYIQKQFYGEHNGMIGPGHAYRAGWDACEKHQNNESLDCVAGCQYFSFRETKHHPECGNYEHTLTKMYEDKIDEEKQKSQVLVEALEFYANPENWRGTNLNEPPKIKAQFNDQYLENPYEDYYAYKGGKRARKALTTYKGNDSE